MEIINSKSSSTSVLIGTTIRQYYLRGEGGALINESLGPDLAVECCVREDSLTQTLAEDSEIEDSEEDEGENSDY